MVLGGATPMVTPMGGMDMATPSPASAAAAAGKVPLTAEQYQVRAKAENVFQVCSPHDNF